MRGRKPESTTGFVGLTADKDMWKVQVCVKVDGKTRPVTLGRFADPEVAAYAYNLASTWKDQQKEMNHLPAYPELWELIQLVYKLGVHNVVALTEAIGRAGNPPK